MPPTNDAEFFPSIGSVASQTDLLPEEQEENIADTEKQDNDDRPMQEVSSLCMSCGEQVEYIYNISIMFHEYC